LLKEDVELAETLTAAFIIIDPVQMVGGVNDLLIGVL
jgi:hypothetical protein